MSKWVASAPSNIALIKYMGKTDEQDNRPTNRSLSYTLNHLRTTVELTPSPNHEDEWQPLIEKDAAEMRLTANGQQRFLKFFLFLKQHLGISDYGFVVRSNNNFPSDCGLASSASSFAALTMATYQAAKDLKGVDLNVADLSKLSRKGSGSSCRSFYSPWAIWQDEGAQTLDLPLNNLHHQVVIVASERKAISSSQAHKMVTNSLLFEGRVNRAETRLNHLINAFENNNWMTAYQLCWEEFWDMHALFETSRPHFGYMQMGTLAILNKVQQFWQRHNDGPLVTMDAGANIHLLYRDDQVEMAKNLGSDMAPYRVVSSVDLY